MTEITPVQPHPAELALARLRAGLTAGLTFEQSARVQGTTAEEMNADATAFATELNPVITPATPNLRSGGERGSNAGVTVGSVAAGAAAYRAKHGLDEDGRRPAVTNGQSPFVTRTYE
ncbi:hypothetical protein ACWD7F_19280 [Streptomyces sp. NPDC005122]